MALGVRGRRAQLGRRPAARLFPVRPEGRAALTTTSGTGPPGGAVRARLEQARVARLATVRPDGRPHVVPVTFAMAEDGRLLTAVDAKPKKSLHLQRLRNIAARPAVSLLVDAYHDDWSQLWWIRVDGDALVVDEPATRTALLAVLVAKYPAYLEQPPAGPLIAITVQTWTSWSAR